MTVPTTGLLSPVGLLFEQPAPDILKTPGAKENMMLKPNGNGKERPVHEVRLGRIKAVIWANEVEGVTRHNVQLRRLYKDGDNWEQTDSFGRDDLPLVGKVADLAHTWIFEHAQDKS